MPFSHPIDVRFRDLDPLGHVNHAVFVTYLEVARTEWWRRFLGGRPFESEGFLIARVEVDYRHPILFGERVEVELRCSAVGTRSFTLHFRVLGPDAQVRAEAQTVQVMFDFRTQQPRPIGPDLASWLKGQA